MSRQLHAQTYVWLQVFACAARHLSFTRCAEELHITPGAVSQQIRQLEERLGFRLFHRRARGVELSAQGSGWRLPSMKPMAASMRNCAGWTPG